LISWNIPYLKRRQLRLIGDEMRRVSKRLAQSLESECVSIVELYLSSGCRLEPDADLL
jgi:hypothetical protein